MSIFVVVKVVVPATVRLLLNVAAPVTSSVDAAVTAPVNVVAPDILAVPSTINPSFILIIEESSELKDVPANLIPPITTLPVPAGIRLIFSLDLVPVILLPENIIAPNHLSSSASCKVREI